VPRRSRPRILGRDFSAAMNAAIDNTANYGGGAAFSYVVLKKK
jgi:hypothetical protein